MRVAILVKEFPPAVIGGTETQTLRMARELHEQTDHEVTVYTKRYPGDPLDVPFELVRIPNLRQSPFLSTLTFVLAAFFYLLRDRRRIDVLQCMMIHPTGFVGYLLHRIADVPYFAWIRGGDYYFMKDNPIKRLAMARVFEDALVLVQTEEVKRDIAAEFPSVNPRILGNGVDIPNTSAYGEYIVYVGRLVDQKGVDRLIRSVQGLNERLLIVGDGPRREELEALADKLEVSAEFAGEVPPESVMNYLEQGKLFVLPSVSGEGLPNAVLEAMAIGLPVIVSDTGGAASTVHRGENGFIVRPDDVRGLRERIERICSDEDLRIRMGENSRQYVEEHFSWPVIIDELEDVYACVRSGDS